MRADLELGSHRHSLCVLQPLIPPRQPANVVLVNDLIREYLAAAGTQHGGVTLVNRHCTFGWLFSAVLYR